jgi:Fuc2NAc and GlcNAc transferase
MLKFLLPPAAAFVLTYFGVEFFRRWSVRKNILDLPNERSSHTRPTPVGGGLIIVFVSLFLFAFFIFLNESEFPTGYFIGAGIVVLISWLDDLYKIPAVMRFVCHCFAAVTVIASFQNFVGIGAPLFWGFNLQYIAPVVLFFWIVWMINAYNFMDGIDGIAALQAITAGIGWIFVAYRFGSETTGEYAAILAASAFGFLLLNWHPAKIFMGDVGSAFFGYTFAVLPFLAERETPQRTPVFFIAALFLLWLFVFDTSVTVLIRILQRKKIWEAHREHLYQKLVIRGCTHQSVTGIYGFLSLLIIVVLIFRLYFQQEGIFFDLVLIAILSSALFVFGQNRHLFNRKDK